MPARHKGPRLYLRRARRDNEGGHASVWLSKRVNFNGCGAFLIGSGEMCDYSLHNAKSRPAKVGDKLTTRDFGTGTRGFASSEDHDVAVCVLPGTELSFASEVKRLPASLWPWRNRVIKHNTAIFRQINKEKIAAHHDALEFPDGGIVLLTFLDQGQQATVLQLPAEPKTAVDSMLQKRLRVKTPTARSFLTCGKEHIDSHPPILI